MGAKKITDGLSNTALLFEIRAGIAFVDWRGTWAKGETAASSVWFHYEGVINGGKDNCDVNAGELFKALGGGNLELGKKRVAEEGMGVFGGGNHQGNPRSMHVGGVHACMADGAVRFISDFIERGYNGSHCIWTVGPYGYSGNTDDDSVAPCILTWERINASADNLPIDDSKLELP